MDDKALEQAVRAALARDEHETDETTLVTALALSEGGVRRALELVSNGGIELYRDILASLGDLPEIEGPELHRLVDRLASSAESERFDLYLALLLGLIERLIRLPSTRFSVFVRFW